MNKQLQHNQKSGKYTLSDINVQYTHGLIKECRTLIFNFMELVRHITKTTGIFSPKYAHFFAAFMGREPFTRWPLQKRAQTNAKTAIVLNTARSILAITNHSLLKKMGAFYLMFYAFANQSPNKPVHIQLTADCWVALRGVIFFAELENCADEVNEMLINLIKSDAFRFIKRNSVYETNKSLVFCIKQDELLADISKISAKAKESSTKVMYSRLLKDLKVRSRTMADNNKNYRLSGIELKKQLLGWSEYCRYLLYIKLTDRKILVRLPQDVSQKSKDNNLSDSEKQSTSNVNQENLEDAMNSVEKLPKKNGTVKPTTLSSSTSKLVDPFDEIIIFPSALGALLGDNSDESKSEWEGESSSPSSTAENSGKMDV